MKISAIIRRSVAGLLITTVALCAFGCSVTKSKKDKKENDQEIEVEAISSRDMDKAFRNAAEEYGLEEFEWSKRYEADTRLYGLSDIKSNGDDAEEIFRSSVAYIFGASMVDEMPEIRDISVFYLSEDNEWIYGHYIVFENEEDCEEYRDMFFDMFGDEIEEEKGYECFTRMLDGRMDALYRDGNVLIWIYDCFRAYPPVMTQYIYDELGLTFPEKTEETSN